MSAPDASGEADRLASAQGARSAQAAQIANIAARLERLPLTSYQKVIFAIIATAWFFDSMDLGALTFVLGSIKQTFQLSTAEVGLLSSLSFLGMFVGAASAGLLADRFGRAKVFQTSMIFWGLGSLACGLSSTVAMLGASRLLIGFGMGMEFPVAQSMVSEIIPAERRGRMTTLFMTAIALSGLIGGPVSGWIMKHFDGVNGWHSWQWLFLLEGLPAIALGVVVLFYMTERPEDARWLSADERSALVEALRREENESLSGPTIISGVGGALASGRVWLLAIVYFTVPIALYAFGFWLPQIIRAASNGTDFQIGVLAAIPYVVGACGMVIVARHSDRAAERRWHIACAGLAGGAAFVVSAFVHGLALSLAALSVAMLGLASMFGPFWALATSRLRGVGAAAAIALINSIGNTGGFVGPYVIGYIRDRTQSFTGGLVFVGVILAVVPLLVLALADDRP